MPIVVSPVVSYRHVFEQDPDGASWIEIKPITARMEQQRAQLLSTQELGFDEAGYMTRRVIANAWDVENEELRLTFEAGHIELAVEGQDEPLVLFDKPNLTRAQFMEDMNKLAEMAPGVRNSWIGVVRGRRPGWYSPF